MPFCLRGLSASAALLAMLLAPPLAAAKQIGFARQVDKGTVEYSYSFNDAEGRLQRLTFRLPEAAVTRGHREYRPIDSPEVATSLKRRVEQSLDEFVRPLGGTITVNVERKKGSLSVHYEVKLPPNRATASVEAEVERRAETATSETYAAFYNVRDASGVEVRPDFARIVPRAMADLKPIADAIAAQTTDERQRIALALAFVQSIPYAVPDRRTQGGFVMPAAFFDLNRGDCDVKSAALAAILMTLLPNRSIVMVLPPEHALLAIDIPSAGDEAKIVVNGRSYVLLEPTGPALWPIGRVAEETGRKMTGTTSETVVLPRLPADEAQAAPRKK
ncbi:hypothetical protein EDC65_1957 [Stella humosa]|uniref:Transglutaminase superfamily protein n=1 Tax=Stella humosa TaxID=94 RepID=A0A3N1M8Y9_9PROT|nr:hypothetical protein [Stella humosa]ROQ00161.1 hypothetical protein EDC65_1957 [Stella humosa]BBK30605.1 hypothetical protein STHU_12390 [Stella humosa]